jgi:DnaK suppressor protein
MAVTRQRRGARAGAQAPDRRGELKAMLEERRRQLIAQLREKMRDVRSAAAHERAGDADQDVEGDPQADIELALLQMESETLRKVDAALSRLEQGSYGDCFQCGEPIAHERLRALPFAIRCRDCEEQRERGERLKKHPGPLQSLWP